MLGALANSTPKTAFTTGYAALVVLQLIILVTVGVNLAQNSISFAGYRSSL